jgi:glycosyltransferase involved in cell wall biosynthesis
VKDHRTMHVAHFIQRYPPALGGSEAYFARLSQWLRKRGNELTVWTSTALDLSAFWSADGKRTRAGIRNEDGISVRRYSPSTWFARWHTLKAMSLLPFPGWKCLTQAHSPIMPRMAYDVLRFDGPCDVVHASAFPYGWPLRCALTLARRRKVPFLLTPFLHHGDPDNPRDKTRRAYTSRSMRYLLGAADTIFVQTELERDVVRDCGIPDERIVLQRMGVDPAECTRGNRERARRAWNVGDECVIGHLATLSKAKGTIDLLQASRRAWNDGATFTLVLAGGDISDFRRYWQNFDVKDRVQVLGPLSDDQKRDFYAGIDAFCLPSRSDSFGLVLLESWANAKSVIAYRAGGPAELVHHGEDGLLVPCGDIDGLAEALRLMERSDLRKGLGDAGSRRIGREFRWEDKLCIVSTALDSVPRLCTTDSQNSRTLR